MGIDLSMTDPNCELVLLCIREGWAATPEALCEAFGYLPTEFHTGHSMILDALVALEGANLISIERKDSDFRDWSLSLNKEVLLRIQVALGLSLKSLAANPREKRMLVSPMFGRVGRRDRRHDVFVLMPFSEDLAPVYRDHIAAVLSGMSLTYARADDLFTAREVMRDVWNGIYNSDLVIADCTSKNPNVFYELGLAHAIGKPVILISMRAEDVPFDVRAIRYIAYEFTPRGMRDFEEKLRATIREVQQGPEFELRRRLYGNQNRDPKSQGRASGGQSRQNSGGNGGRTDAD
jgi:hypothetical protein